MVREGSGQSFPLPHEQAHEAGRALAGVLKAGAGMGRVPEGLLTYLVLIF